MVRYARLVMPLPLSWSIGRPFRFRQVAWPRQIIAPEPNLSESYNT